ncbi:MAG: hypothetical protein O3C60_12340, partial [Planctomycetota bacterium]|nr:hypothetical protein [Planctomycetota bacterium]
KTIKNPPIDQKVGGIGLTPPAGIFRPPGFGQRLLQRHLPPLSPDKKAKKCHLRRWQAGGTNLPRSRKEELQEVVDKNSVRPMVNVDGGLNGGSS